MNSCDSGAIRSEFPAASAPGHDEPSRLQAVFTSPPPTLQLAGDIDEWSYPDLTAILARTVEAGPPRIHVDLAGVDYCDVAGLRAIVALASGQGDGRAAVREIVFTHVPGPLQRVLCILGWDTAPGVILGGSGC